LIKKRFITKKYFFYLREIKLYIFKQTNALSENVIIIFACLMCFVHVDGSTLRVGYNFRERTGLSLNINDSAEFLVFFCGKEKV
jgi:hypothetical protein